MRQQSSNQSVFDRVAAGPNTVTENYDPDNIDENKIHALFRQYRNVLQGLKLKVQTEDIAEYGLKPLTESLRIANDLKVSVAIHSTHPSFP